MNIILIIFLAVLLLILLSVVLYLIFLSSSGSLSEITSVDCPDFWKHTSALNTTSLPGCYVPNANHSSYNNIGKCLPYEDSNGNTSLDYCAAAATTIGDPLLDSNYTAPGTYVGLTLDEINGSTNCMKYNWAKLNGINWNGITNNYNLKGGCLSK